MTESSVPLGHIKKAPPSYSGYSNGCRCDGCREANRNYQREAQRRWRLANPSRRKEIERRWYSENRVKALEYQKRYNKSPHGKARKKKHRIALRNSIRERLNAIKMDSGCVDCGYRQAPEALDFDHVRGEKVMDLCRMATAFKSMKRVLDEVAKCEVVCANCHRIRTRKRREARCQET